MDSREENLGPQPVPRPAEHGALVAGALPSGHLALVRAMQENFLGAFASALAARLEIPVAGELAAPRTLRRSEFLAFCEDGGCLLGLNAQPVRSQALVAFSAGLAAHLLGVLLCAPPSAASGSRTITDIERCILREIFEALARDLTAAWKAAGIAFRYFDGSPEPASGQDTMLVFECRLSLGDTREMFHLALPTYLARVAALDCASVAPEESPQPVREVLLAAVRRANVTVEAVLSSSTLCMRDLLAMEPGHVLMLAQPAGSPVECRIGGKPKFRGEWVRHGNRRALVLL